MLHGTISATLPFGLTHEQLRSELYSAWRKDSREPASAESYKRYRGFVDNGVREKEVCIRHAQLGANFALCLVSLLSRSNVTKIDLYGNSLRDSGAEAIAQLLREAPALTLLNLGANDIGAAGVNALAQAIAGHKKLQVLNLGSGAGADHLVNRIDPSCGKTLLEACMRCKTLKSLELSRNPLGRGTQEVFASIAQLVVTNPNLQALRLSETEMLPESALNIVDLARRSATLTEINLSGNRLTSRVGEVLGSVIEERSRRNAGLALKTLTLNNNPGFGPQGSTFVFRALASDRTLTSLRLQFCNIGDDNIMALCDALDSNGTLTHLDLVGNALSEVGVVELARSGATHPGLRHISLDKNKVRDEGACALAGMLEHNRVVEVLDLSEAWISDRGAVALGVALAGNTSLRRLQLDNNHIGEDGGNALAALLEKNRTLVECNMKGNSIFHCTAATLSRVMARNDEAKAAELPNTLKREVVRLHYQLYKLEDAKSELDIHRTKKSDIERERIRYDSQFRDEELEFVQRRKQLEETIRDQETLCTSFEHQLRKRREDFDHFAASTEQQIQALEERLTAETAERSKADAELARVQAEIAGIEQQRQDRIDELQARIDEAKEDRAKWLEQTKQSRSRVDELQDRLRSLESQLAKPSTSDRPDAKAKSIRRKSEANAQESIAALLGS